MEDELQQESTKESLEEVKEEVVPGIARKSKIAIVDKVNKDFSQEYGKQTVKLPIAGVKESNSEERAVKGVPIRKSTYQGNEQVDIKQQDNIKDVTAGVMEEVWKKDVEFKKDTVGLNFIAKERKESAERKELDKEEEVAMNRAWEESEKINGVGVGKKQASINDRNPGVAEGEQWMSKGDGKGSEEANAVGKEQLIRSTIVELDKEQQVDHFAVGRQQIHEAQKQEYLKYEAEMALQKLARGEAEGTSVALQQPVVRKTIWEYLWQPAPHEIVNGIYLLIKFLTGESPCGGMMQPGLSFSAQELMHSVRPAVTNLPEIANSWNRRSNDGLIKYNKNAKETGRQDSSNIGSNDLFGFIDNGLGDRLATLGLTKELDE